MSFLSFDVGIKNLAFCIYDTENKIKKWEVITIPQNKNKSICQSVVEKLDEYPEMLDVETVLIEKQPSRNNKMRLIECLLNTYFVVKKKTLKVIVYSPKHKLGNNTFKGKSNYSQRKKLSIHRTSQYLTETNSPFLQIFNLSKKKDDLADALLQILSFTNDPIFLSLQNINFHNITNMKIVARKPSKLQEKKGYSLSNIKYLLQNIDYTDTSLIDQKLHSAIIKFYGSLDKAFEMIFPS